MFAIVKTGGKQFKVQVGETIDVEKLEVEEGAQIRLDQVLLAATDGEVAFGRPVIDGAVVTAKVVRQGKGPKLIIFKYKSKSRYRRRTGHRQKLTQLNIQSIEVPGWEVVRAEPAVVARTPVAEGSAAPIDDVLPAVNPTAQVDEIAPVGSDEVASVASVEDVVGGAVEQPEE